MRKIYASSLCKRLLLCASVLSATVNAWSQSGDCTGVPAVHGTFVIDKRVPTNAAAGTFASFNDAYNHIKCGIDGAVVFNVAAGSGVYDEQLVMNALTGSSATNTITFNGNSNTIQFLATDWESRAVVKLNGTDFTRFNNLVIKATGTADSDYGYAVQLTNDADDNTFSQCTLAVTASSYMDSYAGVLIASGNDIYDAGDAKCDRNQFLDNTITGGYFGIAMIGSVDYLNTGNIFKGNTIRDFYNYGIYLGTSSGTVADSNYISRPARTELADYYGIYVNGTQVNSTLSRNRLFNPFGAAPGMDASIFYGLYYDYADLQGDNRAVNNIVYNLTGSGSVYGVYNNSSNNLLIAHNTLLIDGAAAAGNGGNRAAGIYLESSLTDVTAVNNLVTVARSGGGSKYAIYQTRGGDGIVTGYNNFYITPAAAGAKTGYYAGTELATLADWKAASGNDTRSVAVDPLFNNITTGDLVPNSAALDNKGFFLKVTTDIKGSTRSASTPDIGAYEFTPVACPATPAAGTASVYGAPACAGADIGLSLTGYATGAAQTYQWQYAATETGVYTNLGNVLANSADTVIKAATPLYYRVQVTCAGNSIYSVPVYVNINAALPADTYTIDKNAAAGTPKTFLSFNEAKAALTCGITGPVVFNVAPGSGPYEEQLVLDSVPGTSAVNTITFKGNGNTIHFSSNDAQNKAVIKLVKADYIILDSLVVDADGSGAYGYGIQLYNGADNNIVRKCTVIANTSKINGRNRGNHAGIVASTSETSFSGWGEGLPSTANVFEKDSISGGVYGIVIAAGETLAVNNTIADCKVEDGYSGGIRILYATGTVIANNRISRPTSSNVSDFDGIYTEGSDNVQITGNRITDVFKGAPGNYGSVNGIYIQSGSNSAAAASQVANNIVHLNETSGNLYGIYMSYSYNTRFYHNTLLLQNNNADAGSPMTGAYFEGNEDVQFKNNIISVTSTNATDKTAFAIGSGLVTADRNDYYVSNTTNAHVAYYLGTNMPTLAAWQAAASQDGGSVSFDPDFANPAAGDFTPGRGQADNIGLPVGITKDITGANRSATTPDAGAVEFAVAPCSGTPVAGTVAINPATSLCLGTPITLDLAGNSIGGYYLFQWQTAISQTGDWTNISDYIAKPSFATEVTLSTWFRCKVVCGKDTVYTTPVQQQLNALMPAGVYTIDAAKPANYPPGPGANFQSITEAVAALQCGIAGNIIFDIAPGTYTEQVMIPEIPGASDASRITFRGAAGNPAAVKWEYTGTFDNNYVVSFTNASYITIKDISITSLAGPYGRAVVLTGNASADSILGSVITAPAVTSGVSAGVYGELLAGRSNVIKNNTITGGLYGVYLESNDYYALTGGHVIEGNTITDFYTNGVLANKTAHLVISNNQIGLKGTLASTACGVLADGADSAMIVTGNTVTVENTSGTIRGMLFRYSYNESAEKHLIAGNTITAVTGNAGRLHGFNFTAMQSARVINNVINIKTTGAEAYAISATTGSYEFYNNTVVNASTIAGAANSVLYASASIGLEAISRNNIFSHTGGGAVIRVNVASFLNSDYNTFYTTGATMFRSGISGTTTYATLKEWRDATTWDYTSQVYKPAFVSSTDLHPKTDDPEVWAIHGRGVQIKKNDVDFDGKLRPDTLTAGVPDMGAFEFVPVVLPIALTATPAVPAANSDQLFMLGTDTVARIHWGAAVPATVTARRYSGVVPEQLPANAKYMYFYTDINTGGGTYNYAIDHYYIDSWQGFIPKQKYIRLAKTDAAGAWLLSGNGTVNEYDNILYDKSLTSLHQFTGLFDSAARAQEPPVTVAVADTNNLGTHFWASYPVNDYTSFSGHGMVLYLSAAATDADVTVKIHGTTWSRQYHVPANTVVMTEELPRGGSADARVLIAGVSDRSISVVSTQPISVNTYTYTSSGGTMLLPVGAYGYDYQALNYKQVGSPGSSHSFVNVIAAYDSTMIEITPSVPAVGHAANIPFTVMLQEGEVFQLLGEFPVMGDGRGYDLTGTRIRSVKNVHGKCFPAAVFSGSSGTVVSCKDEAGNTGNYIYQQNLPYQAWGKTYLTVPTYGADGTYTIRNVYRVAVKDAATAVKVNGTLLSGALLVNNAYYELESTDANYIEADRPVMVAQYMPSMGNCGTGRGNADGGPEMIYLTPVEQGIKQAAFFRNNMGDIEANYLVVVVPDAGLTSLLIDGRNRFDATYPHAMQGYTVVMKRWDAERIQSTVTCDTTFTGITYGVGRDESYGFNLGINRIRALVTASAITKTLGAAGNTGNTTCAKAPVRFYFSSSIKPGTIEWKFSKVEGLSPAADSIQYPATVLDSAVVDGRWMYRYSVNADFTFSTPGTYYVPVAISGTDISSCDNTLESFIRVVVTPAPEATDFTISFPGCAKQEASFTSSAVTNTGETVKAWKWTLSNGLGYTTQNFTRVFDTAGTYTVQLQMVTPDGCLVDSVKQLVVKPLPVLELVHDTVSICPGVSDVQFAVENPVTGTTYNWYTSETGATPTTTGATVTVNNVTTGFTWYAEAVANGCASSPKVKAVAIVAATPGTPVVTVDSAGLNVLRFAWAAVSNAAYYKVSINNGATWIDPSGADGLSHTLTGLVPGTSVTILVRAYNVEGCIYKEGVKQGAARSGKLFVPNSFTPNGDGLNEVFRVLGTEGVRQFRLMIFNQWGEKVFETADAATGWDGRYKGSLQPSGVYIYICTAVMADTGEKTEKKGSLNLVR